MALSTAQCAYLVGIIAADLNVLDAFPEIPPDLPPFFGDGPLDALTLDANFLALFEKLLTEDANGDTYFACLAHLHKARLKYERIIKHQPIPTIDQVGPRGLLQFGSMTPKALIGFLLWRKWLSDIDNRAGQETGNLFQPIIARALGGVTYSPKKSPIRRRSDPSKGRQVDCLRDDLAYEIKVRLTIAASGQGRWREELEFPADCRHSGFLPVLVVLDPTPNPKLSELTDAFLAVEGRVYIGEDAWVHFDETGGPTMGFFLHKYVHDPINALLAEVPATLPDVTLRMTADRLTVTVGGEIFEAPRAPAAPTAEEDEVPDDADDVL